MRAKFLITSLFILLFSVLGVIVLRDPGYVLLSYGNKVVETSLWVLLMAMGLLFFSVIFIGSLVRQITSSRFGVRYWLASRGTKKAYVKTNEGLMHLAEGDWRKAEQVLAKAADKIRNPVVNYLNAAKAANELGETPKRDEYLRLAMENNEGADIAVRLTQAQLQYDSKQWELCLVTLLQLDAVAPKHRSVLRLLSEVYREIGDWDKLRKLLPRLKKLKVLSKVDYLSVEQDAYRELLSCHIHSSMTQALKLSHLAEDWDALPSALKKDPNLIQVYCHLLVELQAYDQAESTIRLTINRGQWSDELVELYGRVKSSDPSQQLAAAESWNRLHANNAALQLALGRISLQSQQWNKAQNYFESSLALRHNVDAYSELGRLYAQQGELVKSNQSYQNALALVTSLSMVPAQSESASKKSLAIE